ncbi:MAG: hypothetical protein KGH85_05210, partial [Thaumarchaeota archaeon]|nr:hypothetical protein [Nitrososphaerota archaeon]
PPHTNHPIIINKTGDYIVKASLGNTNSEEQFSVTHTSTLDCRKWTQNGWITIPCSTQSLPH